jgi:hypothetical protein
MLVPAALAVCGILAVSCVIAAPSEAHRSGAQRLCIEAFPSADQSTQGRTTFYNRQASVQAVSCNGFGFDVKFHIDGGVVCALVSAAVGTKFDRFSLFIDGSCSAAQLAANHEIGTESAVACGMLSDLLKYAPWAKGYAIAAGLACAFGGPFGLWIESAAEHHAAEQVMLDGKCLKFTTHSFPLTDDWSATRCRRGDPGFSTLPVVRRCWGVYWRTARNGAQLCPRSHSLLADRALTNLVWSSWGRAIARASGNYVCTGSGCGFGPQAVTVTLSRVSGCARGIRIYSRFDLTFASPGSPGSPFPQNEFVSGGWNVPCTGLTGGGG